MREVDATRATRAHRRAPLLSVLLLSSLAGCGGTTPPPQAPPPEPPPPEPSAQRWMPDAIVVGDQRPEKEREIDRRVGEANSAVNGAMREAVLECQDTPTADRVDCERAHRKAARERMGRRFAAMQRVGAAVEACESKRTETDREACAAKIERHDDGPSELDRHSAIDWRWARQVYACDDRSTPESSPCRSIETLTGAEVASVDPGHRWVGAGVVRSYMEHVHHDLVAVELRAADKSAAQLCAMPLGFESEVERRAIAGALQELFSGRDPQRNAAYQRAASHTFQQAECKRVTRSTEGRWRSADGRWVLGATDEGLAFRARNWGPQVALLLAELNEVSPR